MGSLGWLDSWICWVGFEPGPAGASLEHVYAEAEASLMAGYSMVAVEPVSKGVGVKPGPVE